MGEFMIIKVNLKENTTRTMRKFLIILISLMSLTLNGANFENLPNDALIGKGRSYMNSKQSKDTALLCLSIVVRRYYQNPKDKKARRDAISAMRLLGIWYMNGRPEYAKSYKYTASAIAIAQEDGLKEELPSLYCNMASLRLTASLLGLGDEKEVVNNLKKAYRLASETGNERALRITVDNMLNLLGDTACGDEIEDFKHRKLKPTPELTYTRLQIKAYDALRGGDTTRALNYVKQSGAVIKELDATRATGALLKIARLMENQGQQISARKIFREVLSQAQKTKDTTDITLMYDRLAQNYEAAGMPDSAKECRYQWLMLREQLRDFSNQDLTAAQLSQQIEQVNQELLEMSLTRQKREQQLLWLGACLIVVIIVALWIVTASRTQSRHLRVLYEQNLKQLNTGKAAPIMTVGNPDIKEKYQYSPLSDEMRDHLYQLAMDTMENSKEIYDTDFSIDRLGDLTGNNPRYLSQAINQHGTNFPQMLSSYRIKEACRRFNDTDTYGQWTIEAVAQSVGMSRSSFGVLFKKATGLTPAQYRRQALSRN